MVYRLPEKRVRKSNPTKFAGIQPLGIHVLTGSCKEVYYLVSGDYYKPESMLWGNLSTT